MVHRWIIRVKIIGPSLSSVMSISRACTATSLRFSAAMQRYPIVLKLRLLGIDITGPMETIVWIVQDVTRTSIRKLINYNSIMWSSMNMKFLLIEQFFWLNYRKEKTLWRNKLISLWQKPSPNVRKTLQEVFGCYLSSPYCRLYPVLSWYVCKLVTLCRKYVNNWTCNYSNRSPRIWSD